LGDPTEATTELGAKLWDAVVESAAAILEEIVEAPTELDISEAR
jgi:creatinine amidohydrolase/Fe(II)-dependent formamide hydrolase-like protein